MILIMADILAFVADGIATGSTVYSISLYLFSFCFYFVLFLFILFYFKFWDVEQNLIPYVRQMVFAYISIKGWIVDLYVYWFLYKKNKQNKIRTKKKQIK